MLENTEGAMKTRGTIQRNW